MFLTLADTERTEPMFALIDGWVGSSDAERCSRPMRRGPKPIRADRAEAASSLFRRPCRGVGPDPLAPRRRKRGRARDRPGARRPAARAAGRYRHRHRADDRAVRPALDAGDRHRPLVGNAAPGAGQARSGGHRRPACARATCMRCRWPTSSADSVIIHQVLHYAHSPAAAIAEAARVLAPGGTLLVVDFAAARPRGAARPATRTSGSASTTRSMAGWFAAAGLTVDHVEHLEGGELTVTLWRGVKAAAARSGGRHERASRCLDQHPPLFAEARGDIAGQLRILPAQDRDDGGDAVDLDRDARAA